MTKVFNKITISGLVIMFLGVMTGMAGIFSGVLGIALNYSDYLNNLMWVLASVLWLLIFLGMIIALGGVAWFFYKNSISD